jgi:hypothetical protein
MNVSRRQASANDGNLGGVVQAVLRQGPGFSHVNLLLPASSQCVVDLHERQSLFQLGAGEIELR